MYQSIFDFFMGIPETLAGFGNWLVSPIDDTFLVISPLELLGIGGIATIIAIIVIHVVRLFV